MSALRRKPGRPRFKAISTPPKPAYPSGSVSPSPRRRRLPIVAPSTQQVTLPMRSLHIVSDADVGLSDDPRAQADAERLVRYRAAARLRDMDTVSRIMAEAREAAAIRDDPHDLGAELRRLVSRPLCKWMVETPTGTD